ncbi:MAG: GxxExxY protein [Rhodobacterales bacterium]|nr:GxxExxY protein [Rhodobacterales bacterium]
MNTNEHELGRGDSALDPRARDVTNRVVGAAFDVSNGLGHGFLENVYQKALGIEIELRGLRVEEQVAFPVSYKGRHVGTYVADLVVERSVIVELKAAKALTQAHVGQTLNYLKASGIRVGLLFNFGRPKLEFRRLLL